MMTPIESSSGIEPKSGVAAEKSEVSISSVSLIISMIFSTISTFSPLAGCHRLCKGALLYWHKTALASTVLALLVCAPVSAEIYRVINEDGSVTFTDQKPDAPNAKVTEIKDPSIRNTVSSSSNASNYERVLRQEARALETNQSKNRLRQARVASAQQALEDAETALTEGRKIQAGDYIRTAGGGTRLSPAYQQRVTSLTKAVEKAEQALRAARTGQ